ncbi:hypothetical protein F0U44_07870 [Nocardioides humilatus]|uniref:Uncharacterized protein n=1 Tax=Nocardioides humilatus TaxID=2607660 RepID=A0A5B1LHW8_9ACTN|nr:hypothetical protein [Nocardioides humilatus]KAA1420321.1 hypothetical protein F0U44_07870 [Nocardioides humilatus]
MSNKLVALVVAFLLGATVLTGSAAGAESTRYKIKDLEADLNIRKGSADPSFRDEPVVYGWTMPTEYQDKTGNYSGYSAELEQAGDTAWVVFALGQRCRSGKVWFYNRFNGVVTVRVTVDGKQRAQRVIGQGSEVAVAVTKLSDKKKLRLSATYADATDDYTTTAYIAGYLSCRSR